MYLSCRIWSIWLCCGLGAWCAVAGAYGLDVERSGDGISGVEEVLVVGVPKGVGSVVELSGGER